MTEKKDTRFKPGRSGNPGGRPAGPGSRIREELAAAWEEIRPVLLEKAKAGDLAAIRIVAERICPPLRPVEAAVPFTLPDGTLTERADAVLRGVAEGGVPLGSAAQLLGAMASVAKVHEVDEVLRRLAALEKAQEGKR